ncbi:EAL domain-containing protein [Thiomicrorhabdus indica]|uniref:two-component system response regulator n=1 Tax=Thiomicrorhabdus indica TaxID=2267253 RepID=UPI00102D8A8F|nr:EAL domain-containing protein [Thiomicrorhabdus indica]
MPVPNNDEIKILIVEDDQVTRLTLAKVLQKSGYQTLLAENGKVGIQAFMEHHPHLVLMDVMMPITHGFEATHTIRELEKSRAVPILMLTALDDVSSIEEAFEAGATDFITKPINWGLLVQRVKYSLRTANIEDQLRSSQAQLSYAQKLARLGYWEWDVQENLVTASNSAYKMFAVPAQNDMTFEQFTQNIMDKDKLIVRQAIADTLNGQTSIQVSFRVINANGDITHIEFLGDANYSKKGELEKITGSAQDLTRLHKAETLLQYQSTHDSLTSLANRNHFHEVITNHLTDFPEQASAVLVCDIDRFKQINSNLGQELGDQVLRSIAQRLNRITRANDFNARLGNDEFAILIRNYKNSAELNQMLNRLHQDMATPFKVNQQELYISFSSGIATFPDDGKNAEQLLNNANMARAQAKSRGGNQYLYYQSDMNSVAQDALELENALRQAIKNDEIRVFYQPQVDVQTEKPTGAEALVRWIHPERGMISPASFIPLAESTGMIVEIGEYVLRESIKQAEKWYHKGYPLHIGINLSGRQFAQSDLVNTVQSALTDFKLPANLIDLEITESLAMGEGETNINTLKALKALGVNIAIDDFGTGYSSLAYLHSFPIDTLKIDRSFIINLETKEGQAITNTILALAKGLNLEVVAEGVELDEQVEFLREKKCDIFQGFKYGRPMPADDFDDWLLQFAATSKK